MRLSLSISVMRVEKTVGMEEGKGLLVKGGNEKPFLCSHAVLGDSTLLGTHRLQKKTNRPTVMTKVSTEC